jgi:hypothetical protein
VLIRKWKPWRRATGPRTPEGKATASRNSYKGGHRPKMRALSRIVNAEINAANDSMSALAYERLRRDT